MAATTPEIGELRTRVTPGTQDPDGVDGVDELDVVALDAPGWFAKVAGVVALHGGSILAADAFSRVDGIAVDTFRVQRPAGATGSWWARVEGDLVDAAVGRLAVRARVARKARENAPRPGRLPDLPTSLTFSDDPSGRSTVVEVRTLDRIGVLYAIASASPSSSSTSSSRASRPSVTRSPTSSTSGPPRGAAGQRPAERARTRRDLGARGPQPLNERLDGRPAPRLHRAALDCGTGAPTGRRSRLSENPCRSTPSQAHRPSEPLMVASASCASVSGAVSTTLIAGVELIRRGMAEPVGSLTQLGTVRLGPT
jgi:hypothetical protein